MSFKIHNSKFKIGIGGIDVAIHPNEPDTEVTMFRTTARTALLAALLLVCMAVNAEAQWTRSYEPTGQFRFRLGLYEPSGRSDGWDGVFEGFTGQPSDLQDVVWGTDYLWRFGRHTGVLFGLSFYRGKTTSGYSDWVAGDGSEVRHTTDLQTWDMTAAFVYRFGSGGVRPYLGIGGGFVWYRLTDEGYFIDFGDPDLPVFWAWYGAEGSTFEAFGLAGIDIPFNPRWSFFVEGRYKWASDTLGQDYAGFGDLDLSGYEITGGFGVNF